jgi:PAS domain-containing protein
LQQAIYIETVGVIFFNLAGRNHAANTVPQHLSGYLAAFQQGHVRWEELTLPEFQVVTHHTQHKLLTHGQSMPYEQQCIRPDGTHW